MRLSLSLKFCLPLIIGAIGFAGVAFGDFIPRIGRAFEDQERHFVQVLPAQWVHDFREEIPNSTGLKQKLSGLPPESRPAYAVVVGEQERVVAEAGELAAAVRGRPEILRRADSSIWEVEGTEVISVRLPIPKDESALVMGFRRAQTLEQFQAIRFRLAMIMVLVLSGSVILGIIYGRREVAPLAALTQAATRIADTGDLTHTLQYQGSAEIGQLVAAFSKMVARQKEIVVNLNQSVGLLSASVQSLSAAAEDQNQTVARQAAALQETQVTAQEIKQTSLLASQKAEAVIRVAERADELGRAGEAALSESLDGFVELKRSVQEIAGRISELGGRAAQIGGITQTVKDLADQSNMLALNAAIEAVRSGEHGKGFAVVAKEIRLLADQSIQATERVREILEDIGGAISSAVAISEKGTQKMESNLIQVRASGESLKELSAIVRDNSSAVRQIAGAVSQQNAGIAQIFTAVTDLTRMMDDTVKRLESTHGSTSALQELSTRVASFVQSYRV